MGYFAGKTAVITGAGSGIGRALAGNLARQGCNLALSDINEAGLDETASQLGDAVQVTAQRLDVADREAFHRYADEAIASHCAVDIVVNNAGVAVGATVEDTTYETMEWILGVNFWGVVHGTKAFLPHLKSRPRGHVVNISSVFGLVGVPQMGAYNATKFAVRGFTEALRQEMRGSRVAVTCVHPGGIKTNIARDARMEGQIGQADMEEFEKNFITTPETAAASIVKGIRKRKKRVLIGADCRVADWVQRLLPSAYEGVTMRAIRGVQGGIAR